MIETWTPYRTAEELLSVFPILGRLMALYKQSTDDDEATFMQVRTLFFLTEHAATVSELAKKRKVSLQSVSVQVQGLVERGWVIRVPDPTDRRQSLLQVTPEGFAKAQAAKDQLASYLAGFLDELTLEEINAAQVFVPALRRVLAAHMVEDAAEEPISGA